MERPAKRPRLFFEASQSSFDEDLDLARRRNDTIFESTLESIFDKYSQDFTGIGDEVNLRTGQIVVDNGHLDALDQRWDQFSDGYKKPAAQRDTGYGHSLLRAVTVAPEDCDAAISSIENHPSTKLAKAWFEERDSVATAEEDSDLDSLQGIYEETVSEPDKRSGSVTRLSSHDSLAIDSGDIDSLGGSPVQNHRHRRSGSFTQRDFRSTSVDSLVNDAMIATKSGHEYTSKSPDIGLTRIRKPLEQAWMTPDREKFFSVAERKNSKAPQKLSHPVTLSSVFDSVSRPEYSKPSLKRTRKKRSKSIVSDSSEDPLQE